MAAIVILVSGIAALYYNTNVLDRLDALRNSRLIFVSLR